MLKFFLIAFVIIAIVAGLWYLNLNKINPYGFEIINVNSWQEINPRGDAIKSYATQKDNIIISYADVRVIKSDDKSSLSEQKDMIKNVCNDEYKNDNVIITETSVSNLPTIVCSIESKGQNVDKTLHVDFYNIINAKGKQYDYIVTTSYPKDDNQESVQAVEFINNFKVL